MQFDQCSRRCFIVAAAISTLAIGIGVVSAVLGAPLGPLVMGEVSGLACVVAFTLLIWAAIQDGKQPEPTTIG